MEKFQYKCKCNPNGTATTFQGYRDSKLHNNTVIAWHFFFNQIQNQTRRKHSQINEDKPWINLFKLLIRPTGWVPGCRKLRLSTRLMIKVNSYSYNVIMVKKRIIRTYAAAIYTPPHGTRSRQCTRERTVFPSFSKKGERFDQPGASAYLSNQSLQQDNAIVKDYLLWHRLQEKTASFGVLLLK